MTITERMLLVMQDVGAVRKGERNASQGFSFRGIDSVVNAVAPALKKHGVLVMPVLQAVEYAQVEVGRNRTAMLQCRVQVQYVFVAEDGTNLACVVAAEALDSGDKATAKAMSVAFRTALLQALCLPTDDPDPDHDVYERSPAQVSREEFDRALTALVGAAPARVEQIVGYLEDHGLPDEWRPELEAALTELGHDGA